MMPETPPCQPAELSGTGASVMPAPAALLPSPPAATSFMSFHISAIGLFIQHLAPATPRGRIYDSYRSISLPQEENQHLVMDKMTINEMTINL